MSEILLTPQSFDELPTEITTVVVDSIAADVHQEIPCGYENGIAPTPRNQTLENNTPLTALLIGTLVLAAINAPLLRHALSTYSKRLWSTRARMNAFDETHSVSTPIAILLTLIFVFFGGIVLYNLPGIPETSSLFGVIISMGILLVYYLFQYCAYSLIGYVFATPDNRRQWVEGFSAVHAFTGLFLIIPALMMLFISQWHGILVMTSLIIYFFGRLVFIGKGFRVFYTNFSSLFYFILYLCTLEIIPVLFIRRYILELL